MNTRSPTFRLFVSSTFGDMKAEREILQAKVFPKLRDYCKSKGAMFQAVDLRWGISEEAGLDQQTMNICLRELRRCQETTDKPNFFVLLGDRYGWHPLPPQIDALEFEELEKVLTTESTENTERLKRWYRRDDNAVPAQYILLPREGEFEEFGNWDREEKAVRELLLRALETAGWPAADPRRAKYEHSATHQEIDAGALALPDPEDSVLACFRTIKNLPEASDTFSDHHPDGTRDEKARQQLNDLRTALEDRIPKSHRCSYEAEALCASAPLRENLHFDQDAFTAWVEESLRKIIDREIEEKQAMAADPLKQENAEHEAFGRERAHRFVGRKDLLDQIGAYLRSTDSGQTPFVVHGVSGTGKTALMGKAVLRQKEDLAQRREGAKESEILTCRYIGATPGSSNLRSLLVDLCQQLHRALDFDAFKAAELEGLGAASGEEAQKQREVVEQKYGIPDDLNKLIEHFRGLPARVPEARRLVLVLDALDQLDDEGSPHTLAWLPDRLPGNVRVVVSVLDRPGEPAGRAAESVRLRFPNALHEITPLATADAGDLLDGWLTDAGRALQPVQRQSILEGFAECGLPLWLKLVSEEARTWHAWRVPEALPITIPALLDHFLGQLEEPGRHGPELVSTALGYLAAARNGLADEELLDVVALDDDFWTHFTATARQEHQISERRLPPVLWARLHGDLAFALTQRHADNATLNTFYHRQIAEAARQRYLDPRSAAIHSRLGDYFNAQQHFHDGKPNLRKLSELVPQWIVGERWDALIGDEEKIGPLSDLFFIQAKCEAGRVHDLIADYNATLAALPEFCEERERLRVRDEAMFAYNRALRDYAVVRYGWLQAIERGESVAEPLYPPLPPELALPTGTAIPEERSQRAAIIRDFANFVSGHLRFLKNNSCDILSLAFNHAEKGAIHNFAKKHIDGCKKPWLRLLNRPPEPPLRPWCIRTLNEHIFHANCVCVDPYGQTAISGGVDHTLRVWNLETGECTRTLEVHAQPVMCIEMDIIRHRVLSGGADGTLLLWDLNSGSIIYTLEGHIGATRGVCISPDGRSAVSGGDDMILRLWDLDTGRCVKTFEGHTGEINCVSVTPDGFRAISGSNDKTLRIWDLDIGLLVHSLIHTHSVVSMSVSRDGKLVASGCFGGAIQLWNTENGSCAITLGQPVLGYGPCVILVPGWPRLMSSKYSEILVWDINNATYTKFPDVIPMQIGCMDVSSNGRVAVIGSWDNILRVCDMGFKSESAQKENIEEFGYATCFVYCARKLVLLSTSHLHIVDIDARSLVRSIECAQYSFFEDIAIIPGQNQVVTANYDGTLRVWDLENGECLKIIEGHTGPVRNIGISSDGRFAYSSGDDMTIRKWSLHGGTCLRTEIISTKLNEHNLRISPDGRRVICGSGDSQIYLWDPDENNLLLLPYFLPYANFVRDYCVSPDGRFGLFCGGSGSISYFDLRNLKVIRVLTGHASVNCMAFSPDGKFAVTGGFHKDDTVRVWNLETNECVAVHLASPSVHQIMIDAKSCSIFYITKRGIIRELILMDFPLFGPTILTSVTSRNAICPCCERNFTPPPEIRDAIRTHVATLSPEQSPCLELPDTAFDDPRLLATCPHCDKPLKFNPFLVHKGNDDPNTELALCQGASPAPNPPALPLSLSGTASLRAFAKESVRKGHWEAAETFLTKLLAAGDPKQEIIPDIILCLVNAHETVSDFIRAKIDQLLADLEASGHAPLAAQLRQQHAAKLNPPGKKPWWKAW